MEQVVTEITRQFMGGIMIGPSTELSPWFDLVSTATGAQSEYYRARIAT